jgi:hypothetical protein
VLDEFDIKEIKNKNEIIKNVLFFKFIFSNKIKNKKFLKKITN